MVNVEGGKKKKGTGGYTRLLGRKKKKGRRHFSSEAGKRKKGVGHFAADDELSRKKESSGAVPPAHAGKEEGKGKGKTIKRGL